MPEINNEAVKTCSTGEHAALCGVSVRTMNITMKKASYHHQGSPKAVDASIPKPMLLGGNRQQVAREVPYSRLCPPERPCHRHQRCSASRRPSENEPSRCRPLGGQHLPHLAQQTYNAGQSRGGDRSRLQPFRPCRATLYTSTNGGFQKHLPQ